MNTKILMISSTVILGIVGVLLTFVPREILASTSVITNSITILFLQMLGALYLGFAILNWMAKGVTMGGIYNKPIVLGNLMHFGVGSLAMIKMVTEIQIHVEIIMSLMIVYTVFAVLFGYVFKTNPSKIA
ncbi:MAG: hypothetical protein ACJA2N_001798 [Salibacteraceae bacterium]|jgi:hypothetical protein